MKTLSTSAVVTVAALALSALWAPGAFAEEAAEGYVDVDGVLVDEDLGIATTAELDAALLEGGDMTLLVDVETGDIVTVDASATAITPLIAQTNTCSTGQFCLVATGVPYANHGFSGTGTKYGTWTNKKAYRTGNWTGAVWYTTASGTSNGGTKIGPGLTINFSQVVTVTRVTIYS